MCAGGDPGFEMLNRAASLGSGQRSVVLWDFVLSSPAWLSKAQVQTVLQLLRSLSCSQKENINVSREWPRGHRKREPVTQSLLYTPHGDCGET